MKMFVVKAITLPICILLFGCKSRCISVSDIVVNQPSVVEIVPAFRTIHISKVEDKWIMDRENMNHLIYNTKMARLYFLQSKQNLLLMESYYREIIHLLQQHKDNTSTNRKNYNVHKDVI